MDVKLRVGERHKANKLMFNVRSVRLGTMGELYEEDVLITVAFGAGAWVLRVDEGS